jgi:hypothetical protein
MGESRTRGGEEDEEEGGEGGGGGDLGPTKIATAMERNIISMVASGLENRDSLDAFVTQETSTLRPATAKERGGSV